MYFKINSREMTANLSMQDYLSLRHIADLCSQIDLPDEVTESVLKHVENDDFTAVTPCFGALFSPETADRSVKIIETVCSEQGVSVDHGYQIMTVFLAAALHTRELYVKAGIADAIYLATMGFFKRTVSEYKEINGVYGFDRTFWWWRQLSLTVFRIGTLEFEMHIAGYPAQFGFYSETNIPVLWVHIPSDAVMTREALDHSYQTAHAFFRRHYPDFQYRCLCSTPWLLSPILKHILPSGSKILDFQSDYAITRIYADDPSYFIHVFKQKEKPADLRSLPEDTSLQRAIKKLLMEGGTVGKAAGVFVNNRSLR